MRFVRRDKDGRNAYRAPAPRDCAHFAPRKLDPPVFQHTAEVSWPDFGRRFAMPDLADGETFLMQGSAAKPYELKNTGGVYSCSCPAWRNQSVAIERRTCKHLKKSRGDAAETARCGAAPPPTPKSQAKAIADAKAA